MLRYTVIKIIFDFYICLRMGLISTTKIIVMKNPVLPLIFIFFSVAVCDAQKIGIKAGGNFSNVIASDNSGSTSGGSSSGTTDKHSYIPGFHAGLFGEIDLGSVASIQLEALYSTKGFMQKYASSSSYVNVEGETKYTYSYIDVPLLVNIHFGQMASYIGFGPQLSFLSGVKWDGKITNTYTNQAPPPFTNTTSTFEDSGKDKTGVSKTDFGFVLGTGSKWDSGIEYCIRGGYGLTNIIDQSVSTSNDVWHHLVFSVSIGYSFGAGGGGQKDRYGRSYSRKKR